MKLFVVFLIYDRDLRICAATRREEGDYHRFFRADGTLVRSVLRSITTRITEEDWPHSQREHSEQVLSQTGPTDSPALLSEEGIEAEDIRDAKRFWGALSAIVQRPLTELQFRGVFKSCLFVVGEQLFSFISLWRFDKASYPLGTVLPQYAPETSRFSEMTIQLVVEELQLAIHDGLKRAQSGGEPPAFETVVDYINNLRQVVRSRNEQPIKSHHGSLAETLFNLSKANMAYIKRSLKIALSALTPAEFEELCYLLIQTEGRFESVNHIGAKGKDWGIDVIATEVNKGGNRSWAFQCKQVKRPSSDMFIRELDKLKHAPIKVDLVTFITSVNVGSKTIERTLSEASERSMTVQFWGATKLMELLDRNPTALQSVFMQGSTLFEEITDRLGRIEVRLTKKTEQEFVSRMRASLREEVEVLREENRSTQYALVAIVSILLSRLIYEIIVKHRRAIKRLDEDEMDWKRIEERLRKDLEKHRSAMERLNGKMFTWSDDAKRTFIEFVVKEELGISHELHQIINEEQLKANVKVASEMMLKAEAQRGVMAEALWLGFLHVTKLNVCRLLEESKKRGATRTVYYTSNPARCDGCGTRLTVLQLGKMLMVRPNGNYVAIIAKIRLCPECGRTHIFDIDHEWESLFNPFIL